MDKVLAPVNHSNVQMRLEVRRRPFHQRVVALIAEEVGQVDGMTLHEKFVVCPQLRVPKCHFRAQNLACKGARLVSHGPLGQQQGGVDGSSFILMMIRSSRHFCRRTASSHHMDDVGRACHAGATVKSGAREKATGE